MNTKNLVILIIVLVLLWAWGAFYFYKNTPTVPVVQTNNTWTNIPGVITKLDDSGETEKLEPEVEEFQGEVMDETDKEVEKITNTQQLLDAYKSADKIIDKIIQEDIHPDVDDRKWFVEGLEICNEISSLNLDSRSGKKELKSLLWMEVSVESYLKNNSITSYEVCSEDVECKNFDLNELDFILYEYTEGKLDLQTTISRLSVLQEPYKKEQLMSSILIGFLINNLKGTSFSSQECEAEFQKYELKDFS